ncbi:MAG: RDD family protein [Gammaproteobacteria bacterium]|nr:RDD family protein [Gammaproteobacteria bacterium]
MLDTRIKVQTPEGIELALSPAGLLPRCLARLIDTALKAAVYLLLLLIANLLLGDIAPVFIYLGAFAIYWLYDLLFETRNNGRTPGKAVMGIRVVNSNGAPVTLSTSVIRNLLRVVDFLPLMYLLGAASTLLTHTFQRLGDIVAGTYVVYAHGDHEMLSRDNRMEKPLPLSLRAVDHQAIMLFDERISALSEERVNEIAGLLGGHISGTPAEIRAQLQAHARWLTGGSA